MRLLVCGSRTFAFRRAVFETLDNVHKLRPITCIIEGGATGADALAGLWAKENHIELIEVPADWKTHGKAAGPIRNKEMLRLNPDKVFAFVDKPLKESRGTAHMVSIATKEGVPTKVFEVEL